MNEIVSRLTEKDNKLACAASDKIIFESQQSDKWYAYFELFTALLMHPNSFVRNRALNILAANAQWDKNCLFDNIIDEYLSHITDEKPITARQCIKALVQVGTAIPRYIPQILNCLQSADLTRYKDSMRPLIERDIAETIQILTHSNER